MKIWIMILGMALATYIPRLLPLVGMQRRGLPSGFIRFLRYIPVAALSSLIFPAALYSTGDTNSAIAGVVTAVGLALARLNVIFVVLGAIISVWLWQLLGIGTGIFP